MSAGIRLFFIGEPRQIIHICFKRKRYIFTLFKGKISLSIFYFRIVALVDAGQQLHFYLRIPFFFPKFLQEVHPVTPVYSNRLTDWH